MAPKFEESIESVDGIRLRSEEAGYRPDEMPTCGRCGRPNPPNRFECLYCGESLTVGTEGSKGISLKVRELEAWEMGFNVVFLGQTDSIVADEFVAILNSLGIDSESAEKVLRYGSPTPLIRVPTEDAGSVISERIAKTGANIVIVSDEDLAAETYPIRLRSCSVENGKLTLTTFNTSETIEFSADQLRLIVTGSIVETRSEKTLKRKKGKYQGDDDAVVSSDTGVADIYFDGELNGFRIMTTGFDFSFLGNAKGILAGDNLRLLVSKFEEISPNAKIFSDYQMKRKFLDSVWPCESRNESKGIKRSGFGLSLSKGEVTSNVEQFTKYSRLLRRTL